jgi:hypothetical protein
VHFSRPSPSLFSLFERRDGCVARDRSHGSHRIGPILLVPAVMAIVEICLKRDASTLGRPLHETMGVNIYKSGFALSLKVSRRGQYLRLHCSRGPKRKVVIDNSETFTLDGSGIHPLWRDQVLNRPLESRWGAKT